MKNQLPKQCCIRIPDDLHRRAKLHAYSTGFTLQSYIIHLIEWDLKLREAGQKIDFTLSSPSTTKG